MTEDEILRLTAALQHKVRHLPHGPEPTTLDDAVAVAVVDAVLVAEGKLELWRLESWAGYVLLETGQLDVGIIRDSPPRWWRRLLFPSARRRARQQELDFAEFVQSFADTMRRPIHLTSDEQA